MLPGYISKATPNPASNRLPWYKNIAPTYAGIYLWIVFYREIAGGTLDQAGLGLSLLALLIVKTIRNNSVVLRIKAGDERVVVGKSYRRIRRNHSIGSARLTRRSGHRARQVRVQSPSPK